MGICTLALVGMLALETLASAIDDGIASSDDGAVASAPIISDTGDALSRAVAFEGTLELPVAGATGYAGTSELLRSEATLDAAAVATLDPGSAFTIREERDGWWRVRTPAGAEGWVHSEGCFINLPDVIPSIVYDDTNAYDSRFTVAGTAIPGVTDSTLYVARRHNARLGGDAFDMAVLYPMAERICAAQRAALADGYTLVIYEGFRPYDVQVQVAQAVQELMRTDAAARVAVSTPPWSIDWFIATRLSNHQQGYAIDTSLARVTASEERVAGGYRYTRVTGYVELAMPTGVHELGSAAAALSRPVSVMSDAAWRQVPAAAGMNEAARLLQSYATDAGLTPLASEWWHFNDLASASVVDDGYTGRFTLAANVSEAP
ncbi:MAG TPA: SH3 domain-containing protein [Candidatus Coprousia avicola]|nr:SH3 domain-containing protein [Candidatus Coprousia avicola]